ncbi:uracil phosphoribosyltransferase [Synechococcus sp. RSCCF101]|nr:uracil phosphoribosyltransferase [Synechococcus sp. RSCCF101]QEY33363.1 uracil phosphoribosyltransferase [Synechococcus sp. RSCCF101]
MSKAMRVVVPPHPLIAHWLTVLRDRATPAPLLLTALEELGHWLCYEALRDWLPHRPASVETPLGTARGQVIDAGVPLMAIQVVQGGQELWNGARRVLPMSRLVHVMAGSAPAGEAGDPERQAWARMVAAQLPGRIDAREGVMLLLPVIGSGALAQALLQGLAERGCSGRRVRLLTAIACQPGLQALAELWPDLTIHTACIDPDCDEADRPLPGVGDLPQRLYGLPARSS